MKVETCLEGSPVDPIYYACNNKTTGFDENVFCKSGTILEDCNNSKTKLKTHCDNSEELWVYNVGRNGLAGQYTYIEVPGTNQCNELCLISKGYVCASIKKFSTTATTTSVSPGSATAFETSTLHSTFTTKPSSINTTNQVLTSSQAQNNHRNNSALIGGLIGGILVLLIVIVAILLLFRKRRNNSLPCCTSTNPCALNNVENNEDNGTYSVPASNCNRLIPANYEMANDLSAAGPSAYEQTYNVATTSNADGPMDSHASYDRLGFNTNAPTSGYETVASNKEQHSDIANDANASKYVSPSYDRLGLDSQTQSSKYETVKVNKEKQDDQYDVLRK